MREETRTEASIGVMFIHTNVFLPAMANTVFADPLLLVSRHSFASPPR